MTVVRSEQEVTWLWGHRAAAMADAMLIRITGEFAWSK